MNTKQLVVICYAGVVTVAILFFYAADHSWSPLPLIACTIAAAALLVYTFRPLPNVNKKRLLVFVAPFVLLLSLVGLLNNIDLSSLSQPRATRIALEPTDVEFFDVHLTYDAVWSLQGRIRNKSSAEVDYVTLKVFLYDASKTGTIWGQLIDTGECNVKAEAGPGDVRRFDAFVYFGEDDPPLPEWRWRYEIIEVW